MAPQDKKSRPVASFEIHYSQVLNPMGELVKPLPYFAHEPNALVELYQQMVRTRVFDLKVVALQRTGKMGTYAPNLGQEAIGVGIGHAMKAEDVLLPTYREVGAQLMRHVTMKEIMLYWGGDERGMAFENQPHDFPIAVPIASQVPHAAGVAYAMKLRKEPRVAVVTLGDGASSKGDFYEALNAAGAWHLPLVFIVTNNHWAISVPRKTQTAAETLAQKGIAAGVPGKQVDGNDVIAVRHCIGKAIEQARQGGGPSLIEPLTYRMGDHTTADDASRYRSNEELEEYKRFDPISRMRTYLESAGIWSQQKEDELNSACSSEVEASVQAYLNTPPQAPESMFDDLYAELPRPYQTQRNELLELLNKGGK
ncbi:pyruvate dehydrogenase (acetyl-transferring) E1 component subunit alpha [Pseudomonadota bacterium]